MKHAFIMVLSVLAFSAAGAEVDARAEAQTGATTNAPAQQTTNAPIKELADSLFQGRAGDGLNYQPTPMVRTEAGDKLAVIYSPGLELQAVKPINVLQSKTYLGLEYSGSLVQAVRSNPLQLINPFAPAIYGNGEANTAAQPRH